MSTLAPWQAKAHRLIAEMSKASFERANRLPSGALRKRHVPYSIPEDARTLVACLADPANGEARAKALFQALAFREMGEP